jgi:ABC-type dipeptide/oligopeptide/nickel transport system permease subunit
VSKSVTGTANHTLALADRLRENQAYVLIRSVLSNTKGVVGTIIVGALVFIAIAAPWIAPYNPIQQHLRDQLKEPSVRFLFGTDELGRDILSRVIYGTRISLMAGLVAVLLAGIAGAALGLIAGYNRGWLDSVTMRLLDTLLAFPAIFLAIGIVAVIGPGHVNATLAVAFIYTPQIARLVRATTLAETAKDYVEAARCLGASDARVVLKAIFPNCAASVVVQMAIAAPAAVIIEASLAFLGLGTQPPTPSWGAMLQTAQGYLSKSWTYGVFPGSAITLLAVGLNYLGDSLQDALDPRRTRAAAKMG